MEGPKTRITCSDLDQKKTKTVVSFVEWKSKRGMTPAISKGLRQAVSHHRLKKETLRVPELLTQTEITALLSVAEEMPVRDNLLVRMFLQSGIRLDDLINLKVKDVDLHNREIKVGKTGFTHFFNERCRDLLEQYLQNRSQDEFLFTSQRGERLNRHSVYWIVSNAGKKAHIHRVLTPQLFRRTFVNYLLSNYLAKGEPTPEEINLLSGLSPQHIQEMVFYLLSSNPMLRSMVEEKSEES